MDEMPAAQTPPPLEPLPEAHPPAGRRVKRRMMFALLGLYSLSLAAALLLILRGPGAPARKEGEPSKGLLVMQEKDTVGWVAIRGPIYNSESGRIWEKGTDQWSRRIRQLAETKGVRAIVLDINSPGGSVGAVQELYSQIQRVRKEKKIPVIALFDDVAASGGYYIAAACDKIVAHPGSLTGSIGVIFQVGNVEGLFNKLGVKMDPVKSGKHKDIGSPTRAMTPEERQLLQALIDDAYKQFVAAVSAGRRLSEDQVRALADGRIFSGQQALESKLVDMVGDSTDALELAGKLGGIPGRPKIRRDGDRFGDILDLLDSKFNGILSARSALFQELVPAARFGLEYRWSGW